MISDADFAAWLKRDDAPRVVLCELDYVYEGAGQTVQRGTIYLANFPYITEALDVPSSTPYRDLIADVPNFSRSVDLGTLGGHAVMTIGNLDLHNEDGAADFMLGLIVDGCECRFYLGDKTWARSDFQLAFTAIAETVSAPSLDHLQVRLHDRGYLLNTSIVGPVAGGATANAAKPVPIIYGYVFNLEPISIDAANLKYSILCNPLAGAFLTIYTLRDNGLAATRGIQYSADNTAMTFNAGTDTITFTAHGLVNDDVVSFVGNMPTGITGNVTVAPKQTLYWVVNKTANTYQLSLTRAGAVVDITGTTFAGTTTVYKWPWFDNYDGTFYLAHAPAGRVTVDAANDVGYGAPYHTSDVLPHIAINWGGLQSSNYAGLHPSFTAFGSGGAEDSALGVIVPSRENVADVLDQCAFASNAFWGFNRRSQMVIGRIDPSSISSTPVQTFTRDDMSPGSVSLDRMAPQYSQVQCWARMNAATQTDGLAGAVTASDAQRLRARGLYTRSGPIITFGQTATASFDSASSGTINFPAGLNIGDLLVLHVASNKTINVPTGFTAHANVTDGVNIIVRLFTRVVDGTEASPLTVSLGSAGQANMIMTAYGNVQSITSLVTSFNLGSSSTYSVPTQTGVQLNDLVVAFASTGGSVGPQYPNSFTAVFSNDATLYQTNAPAITSGAGHVWSSDTVSGGVYRTFSATPGQAGYAFILRPIAVSAGGYSQRPDRWHSTMIASPDFDTAISDVDDAAFVPGLSNPARTWGLRRASMFLPHVDILSFETNLNAYALELADAINVTLPQFGLANGANAQVVSLDTSLTRQTVTVKCIFRRVPASSVATYG